MKVPVDIEEIENLKKSTSDPTLIKLIDELISILSGKLVSNKLETALRKLVPQHFEISVIEFIADCAWPYFKDQIESDAGLVMSTHSESDQIYHAWAQNCLNSSSVVFFLNARASNFTKELLFEKTSTTTNSINQLDKKLTLSEEPLKLKLATCDELIEKLTTYIQRANFVNLSAGFSELIDASEIRLKSESMQIKIIGLFMLLIPAATTAVLSIARTDFYSMAIHTLPTITIELILFYFFRISYQSWKSTSGQILQLKNKKACLQFIENYIDFKSNKQIDNFDKFESLIFSGIVTDDSKIPPAFDGIDQLANLIKSLKVK